jgi:alkanesulfonate monooxygenase SsuD/methylene tetrahydromethanopterin reductase-like flavin-dependent oxidoreductase (luciferase family)
MARIGFALSRGLPPGEIVDCIKLAEELGYESAWVAEGHGGDQFAVLAAAAAVTTRIQLGTSINKSLWRRSKPVRRDRERGPYDTRRDQGFVGF